MLNRSIGRLKMVLLLVTGIVSLHSNRSTASGPAGRALLFDGGDLVLIPHASSVSFTGSAPGTFELWVLLSQPRPVYHILSKRAECGSTNYHLARDKGQLLHFGSGGCAIVGGPDSLLNEWVHVAVTCDGSFFRMYIDDNPKPVAEAACMFSDQNEEPLKIGDSGTCASTQRFPGLIDEVRIWNVTRTPEEIVTNWNTCVDPNEPGLVGYWKFDEATNDQMVTDSSPFGNDGTLGPNGSQSSEDPTRVESTAPIIGGPCGVVAASEHSPGSPVFRFTLTPNPASGAVHIAFTLADSDRLTARIFDLSGRLVDVMVVDQAFPAGLHTVAWNGQSHSGIPVPGGIYIVQVEAGGLARSQKLVLLR